MASVEVERFGLVADGLGFVDRACAVCARPFQVSLGEYEARGLLRALAHALPHANDGEDIDEAERVCPYCGVLGTPDAWLTAEQRAAVAHRAAHWQREVRYVQLAWPRHRLGDNPRLTYLPVPPAPFAAKPGAPAPGPAMRAFPLLCCKGRQRILDGWRGPVRCHHCGCEHEIAPHAPGLLERLERDG